MTRASANDLDYLATRLHARRSRMAEAERLDELCRVRTLPELGRALFPGAEISVTADFQRRLVEKLVREISDCLKHLEGEAQELMAWLLARFQWEDAKILLRGFLNLTPLETLQPHLVDLPSDLALDTPSLMSAKSLEDFVTRLPVRLPAQPVTDHDDRTARATAGFPARSGVGRRVFSRIDCQNQPAVRWRG